MSGLSASISLPAARRIPTAVPTLHVAAGAVRGLAVGLLAVSLAWAAYASENLRTGVVVLDWAIGMSLVCLPVVVVLTLVRFAAALAGRCLRFAGRHGPARARPALLTAAASTRQLGSAYPVVLIVIPLLVWATPSDGPVTLYRALFSFEIPIAAGGVVGLLAGAATALWRSAGPSIGRSVGVALTAVPALVVAAAVTAWTLLPGWGAPRLLEDTRAVAAVPKLALPDPSVPGPHAVARATFGSGIHARRPEFGAAADWLTPTVDAHSALGSRGPLDDLYARWFWGFDATQLPLNGLAWYPVDATGRLPVVLLAHGNHSAGDFSDPGYAYLAEHLASRGMLAISVDHNYLNGDAFFDYGGREMGVRAWLLLRQLEQLRAWDADPDHPLAGRVDLSRVALIGHSRGGEAAAVAHVLNRDAQDLPGLPPTPHGFGVRAVIAFAPSTTMYRGAGSPVVMRDVDYLVMQGAHDADLLGFAGLQAYHRTDVGSEGDHLKVALYSGAANHGRFNSVWDYGDAGTLVSWMLDRSAMLADAEQQRLARTAVTAFLMRSLFGETDYDAFFRDPRAGRDWLPEDVVLSHWQGSQRVVVEDFRSGSGADDGDQAHGFSTFRTVDPMLRDGGSQHDRAAEIRWSDEAALTVTVDGASASRIGPDTTLVFSMAPAAEAAAAPDLDIVLEFADGGRATARLGDIAPPRPGMPAALWKAPGLADRYVVGERQLRATEHFLQTYALPLSRFTGMAGRDSSRLQAVSFHFDGQGAIYLDDIGFEGPVRP